MLAFWPTSSRFIVTTQASPLDGWASRTTWPPWNSCAPFTTNPAPQTEDGVCGLRAGLAVSEGRGAVRVAVGFGLVVAGVVGSHVRVGAAVAVEVGTGVAVSVTVGVGVIVTVTVGTGVPDSDGVGVGVSVVWGGISFEGVGVDGVLAVTVTVGWATGGWTVTLGGATGRVVVMGSGVGTVLSSGVAGVWEVQSFGSTIGPTSLPGSALCVTPHGTVTSPWGCPGSGCV